MAHDLQFKTWPARDMSNQIEGIESERFQNWVTANDVRKVVPSLRKDAVLQQEHVTGVEHLDKSKRLFFNEQALTAELKRNCGQDASMFLAWFERTIVYPARRKREGLASLAGTPAVAGPLLSTRLQTITAPGESVRTSSSRRWTHRRTEYGCPTTT